MANLTRHKKSKTSAPNTKLNKMMDSASWRREKTLKEFCARQLLKGRLALVLGAGTSMGCGLPDWDELIKRSFGVLNKKTSIKDNKKAAELLLANHCNSDRIKFSVVIQKALYKNYKLSAKDLSQRELLSAIAALTMSSLRGNVSRLISYNFDDLLETYLRYYGYIVKSIANLPIWNSHSDVLVYHPHGILPSDSDNPVSPIVMTQCDYDEIVGKNKGLWREAQLDVFRSNTCLFIGISGDCDNLTNILHEAHGTHASKDDKHPYWGIRFSSNKNDQNKPLFKKYGIFQQTLKNYDDLPSWLLSICQLASSFRK